MRNQSYTQRFRVLEPSRKAIQEALADALMLPELPRRIECFDISHIQGAETVASLVVWEDGKMNKSAYRKFKIMTVARRRRLRLHARGRRAPLPPHPRELQRLRRRNEEHRSGNNVRAASPFTTSRDNPGSQVE